MIVKLLTEHHLKYLSLKGGCTGPSESTHVKMPHCWKSHALAICIGCRPNSACNIYIRVHFLKLIICLRQSLCKFSFHNHIMQ